MSLLSFIISLVEEREGEKGNKMSKMILSNKYVNDMIFNELTKCIDKYIGKGKKSFKSYIYNEEIEPGVYYIRKPGMTIGNLKVMKDNIIGSIKFNPDIVAPVERYRIERYFNEFIGAVFKPELTPINKKGR